MRPEPRARRLLTAGLLALALCGCTELTPETPASAPARRATPRPARDPVVALLEYARQLTAITPQARAQAVANARKRANDAPSAERYARLALAYGTPKQRRYTPDEAARYARLALDANDAAWSPAAEQYLGDYARLYTRLTDTEAEQDRTSESDEARIARLRARLAEAHRKLREMADIEDRLSAEKP